MDSILPLLTGPAGALVTFIVILYGGRKKWWVFGWQYSDLVRDRDEWKAAALRGTYITERAVTLREKGSQEHNDAQ